MSIKESMMYMIEDKIPGKTREELVEKLFELENIKKENNNGQDNSKYLGSSESDKPA